MPRRPTTRLRLTNLEDRLTPAGGLDPTFGTGGVIQAAEMGGGVRAEVAFQPDGRLLVVSNTGAGLSNPVDGRGDEIARFLADGSPDASFGVNGRVAPLAGRILSSSRVAVAPDGKIVVFGNSMADGEWGFRTAVLRLNADGSLDATFGTGGSVVSPQLPYLNFFKAAPNAVAVAADGSVVVAGADLGRLVVTRLDAAGAIDAAFGSGGRFVQPHLGVSTHLTAVNLALLPDGGVVASGDYTDFTNSWTPSVAAVVTVLTAAGLPDASFSEDGLWSSAAEGQSLVTGGWSALAVQADGKLVLTGVGPAAAGGMQRPLVAFRLNADGTADAGFGTDGQAVVQADGVYAGYVSLGLLSDGRIVVGASRNLGSAGGTVSVLNPDGTPDDYYADGSGQGQVVYGPGGLSGPTSVGDLAVFGDRIAVVSSISDQSTMGTTFGSDSSLGLAVLAERPDALPTYTPPVVETPPPVVGFPPLLPYLPGEGEFLIPPMPGETIDAVRPIHFVPLPMTGETIDAVRPIHSVPTTTIVPPLAGRTDEELAATSGASAPVDLTIPPILPLPVTVLPQPVKVPNDFNGDGFTDKVVTDGAKVSVVSGSDGAVLLKSFAPFEASYAGTLNAVFVDVDGNGEAELVVSPGQGGGPVVAVYNADGTERGRFWGLADAGFRGGVNLATGDVNADGRPDLIVTAGEGGGPRVAIFDGRTLGASPTRLVADFFAFEAGQSGGVTAGLAKGVLIFAAGPGGGPRVRGVDAGSLLAAAGVKSLDDLPAAARKFDRFVGDPSSRQGVKLDFKGVNNAVTDQPGKVTATAGDGEPVTVYEYPGFTVAS